MSPVRVVSVCSFTNGETDTQCPDGWLLRLNAPATKTDRVSPRRFSVRRIDVVKPMCAALWWTDSGANYANAESRVEQPQ